MSSPPPAQPRLGDRALPLVTLEGIAWGVTMSAGTTARADPIWYRCLRRLDATQAGLFQLAIPWCAG